MADKRPDAHGGHGGGHRKKKHHEEHEQHLAHDESNQVKTGQSVRIRECRPLSKRKRWEVVSDAGASA